MDIENTETLGLGQMVERVAILADKAVAGLQFIPIPPEALPDGIVVGAPHILAKRDGDGMVWVESLKPFIDEVRGKPDRRRGTATVTTLASFSDLVNRNGDAETLIFVDANWRAPKLTAVLNYHVAAQDVVTPRTLAAPAGDDPLARFGDHRVVYPFPLSEPWKVWVAHNGAEKAMKQDAFAAFLEDHIHEIGMPDSDPDGGDRQWEQKFRTRIATPNELIDLARGLEVTVGAKIKTKTRLQTGEMSLQFEVEHRDANGGELTVPGLFWLQVPVFYRGATQRILVRLRYRPAGEAGIMWFYEIFRPDEAVDERVRADVEEVAHQTGCPVIDGAPETAA